MHGICMVKAKYAHDKTKPPSQSRFRWNISFMLFKYTALIHNTSFLSCFQSDALSKPLTADFLFTIRPIDHTKAIVLGVGLCLLEKHLRNEVDNSNDSMVFALLR